MSVREYSLKFNSLARYATIVVYTMEDRVHRYVDRLDSYLVRDCTIASLNKNMDIARMQAFAQNLADQRQRRRTQESETGHSKRDRSIRQFTPSQGEFRPRFSNRPPKPSYFYSTTSAPPRFQGFRGNQFGQRSESQGHMMINFPHSGVGGMAQPTRSVAASSSSTPSLSKGKMPTFRGRGARGAASSSGVQNCTYALGDRQNLEASPEVVTGKLHFMLQAHVLQLVDLLNRITRNSATFGELQVDSEF
uniref:Gag-pol polyprotein n=1 Tax=Solanum tuberosum TaxID=4113 RepID=M1DJ38_SOLTU